MPVEEQQKPGKRFERHIRSEDFRRYFLQCGLAGIVVLILLLLLDTVTQTVLIAALGSSAFVAFAVPHSLHSSPRHLVGGYCVGLISGCLLHALNVGIDLQGDVYEHAITVLFGAMSISLAMFLMVVTRTEHPPAAALALGLVLNEWSLLTLLVVMLGIIALSLVKRLVLPILLDLL